jgi:hypothetical protein
MVRPPTPARRSSPSNAGRRWAPPPSGIDLLLTDACNLRCTYCLITTDARVRRPAAVMDTERALCFLAEVAAFRPMIRVFGGEPFPPPGGPRIFAAAVGHGLPLTVVPTPRGWKAGRRSSLRSGLSPSASGRAQPRTTPSAATAAFRRAGGWWRRFAKRDGAPRIPDAAREILHHRLRSHLRPPRLGARARSLGNRHPAHPAPDLAALGATRRGALSPGIGDPLLSLGRRHVLQ